MLVLLQDLVEELSKQQWYVDRKGENPPDKKPYYQLPIFNYYKVSLWPALLTGLTTEDTPRRMHTHNLSLGSCQ